MSILYRLKACKDHLSTVLRFAGGGGEDNIISVAGVFDCFWVCDMQKTYKHNPILIDGGSRLVDYAVMPGKASCHSARRASRFLRRVILVEMTSNSIFKMQIIRSVVPNTAKYFNKYWYFRL